MLTLSKGENLKKIKRGKKKGNILQFPDFHDPVFSIRWLLSKELESHFECLRFLGLKIVIARTKN